MTKILARSLVVTVLLAFVLKNLIAVVSYGLASIDGSSSVLELPATLTKGQTSAMTELPEWTSARAVTQLIDIQTMLLANPGKIAISDASDVVATDFEAGTITQTPLLFLNAYVGPFSLEPSMVNLGDKWSALLGRQRFRAAMNAVISKENAMFRHQDVVFPGESGSGKDFTDRFFLDQRVRQAILHPKDTLLLRSFNWTLLNNDTDPGTYDPTFSLRPYAAVRNYLILVPSDRDRDPPSPVMTWRFVDDYWDFSRHWEAMGRYLLFHVVNPSRRFRVVLDVSTTTMGPGRNLIPPASVLGATRVWFPDTGYYGAGRLISPPLSAQVVAGLPFIELDMGRNGAPFPDPRHGVMTLYGKRFNFDYRHVVAFNRDISIITDKDYRSLQAPEELGPFPKALEDPDLEFAGLYEDGWMADRAVVWLSAPKQRTTELTLRALVPYQSLEQSVKVTLDVDGSAVASQKPSSSDLVMRVAMPGDGRRHEIRITASPVFHLPGGDGRPATIRVDQLGFD